MVFRNTFERKLFAIGVTYSIVSATVLLLVHGDVYSAPDSYSHIYIPASVFRNGPHSKPANLGTVWLPMYHILLSPLTLIKQLYSTGLAATIINGMATGGVLVYSTRIIQYITDRKDILYGSVILFLSHTYTAIYSATPMTEQLSIFFGLAGVYYFLRYWSEDHLPYFVTSSAFLILTTLTRYEFWLVAASFVVLMAYNEVREGRTYNLAFFHLPLWGGLLWIIWNAAIFKNPLAFVASNTMPVSVGTTYPLTNRILFLGILPIIGGATFILPLFHERKWRILVMAPAAIYGTYVVAYLFEYVSVISNMRFGYLLFGMLLPTVVVLRNLERRYAVVVLGILIVTSAVSSGLAVTGAYADVIGPGSQVQETTDNRADFRGGTVLVPIQHEMYDMNSYPETYIDGYDEETWIRASKSPWKSEAEFVLIPPYAANQTALYRDSGPTEGIVWNFYENETWRQTFLEHFEVIDPELGLYRRNNSSVNNSISNKKTVDDSRRYSTEVDAHRVPERKQLSWRYNQHLANVFAPVQPTSFTSHSRENQAVGPM